MYWYTFFHQLGPFGGFKSFLGLRNLTSGHFGVATSLDNLQIAVRNSHNERPLLKILCKAAAHV